jgi:hypothetical protein
MANSGERISAPGESLATAKQLWAQQRRRELGYSLATAEEVVQAGGLTSKEVFLFAMHRLMLDRPTSDEASEQLAYYKKLEERFSNSTAPKADRVIARRTTDLGVPTVEGMGLLKPTERDVSPLQFSIKSVSSHYEGLVRVPITDCHVWNLVGDNDELTESPEDMITLARAIIDDFGDTDFSDFSNQTTVGLQEAYGIRKLGSYPNPAGDVVFMRRIATFLDHTGIVQQAPSQE